MRIIGIDPGSIVCGYGVIEQRSSTLQLIEYGVVEAKRASTELPQRLEHIYHRLNAVIDRTRPDAAAMEALFYARNVQSLVKLAHARGVAMLVLAEHNLPIAEYAARLIKRSISGKGNASKEQVSFMVKSMLGISETPEFFDATDALAIAITHALRTVAPSPSTAKRPATRWKEFLEQNPDRIVKR
jgi:crossover junction endodeoxyribonuclease RuvC